MFCEECGTKNEKGAAFCEKCGHKLQEVKEEKTKKVVKKVVKEKKPMSTGKKVLIGTICLVVVVLIAGYMFIANSLKPEKIALKYFKAYAAKDADALANVITLNDSEFVSKKLLKDSLKDDEKIKLANYSTEKSEKTGDLSTSVTIKYVEEGSSKEKTKTIKLTKNKNKKWLIFDNWTVDSSELTVEDYSFSVPAGSKAYINGIEVKDKYKKDSYSSYYDSYTIPSILKGEYTITAELKSGIKLSGKATINNSYSSFSSSSLKLDDKTKETIEKDINDKIKTLYQAAIDDKSFDDIKDNFSEDYKDDFEYKYDSLKNYIISEYNKLVEFEITDLNIKSYTLNDDGIDFTVQMKYNYKVEYKSGDETKDYSKKGQTDTFYVDYVLGKKDYIMSDFSSLVSYFSHYGY